MGHLRDMVDYYQENRSAIAGAFTTLEGFVDLPQWEDVLRKFDIHFGGKLILEVGCGGGHIGRYCREQGGLYMGVDITPFCTDKAKEIACAPILEADGQELPFKKDAFDLIICLDTFEHFEDQGAAAREFRRVLKEGGVVLLSVPNYSNLGGLVKWAKECFGSYSRDTFDVISWDRQVLEQFMTPGRVKKIFRESGFTQFRLLGRKKGVILGLFPWRHRPETPRVLRGIFGRIPETVLPIGLINRLFPGISVHNFWKIS